MRSVIGERLRNCSGEKSGSPYSDSLRSVLITLLGSGVSAAIGFFVQEFLRSKKTTQAAELTQHL